MSPRQGSGLIKLLMVCALMLIAAGCGGGSGSSVISLNPSSSVTETLQIDNPSLQISGTANVTARFVDSAGRPLSALTVAFTTTSGTLNPGNGSVQTDGTGAATIQLIAGNTVGTGIITASATVNGTKVSKAITFAVAMPQVNISTPVVGLTSLAPGGSTGITVNITDASGNPFTTPVDVSFTSNFAASGKATLTSPVTTVNGVASSTYTAAGGVGTDIITISVGTVSVTTTVTVAGVAANSISFVSATPTNITLKNVGGITGSETSTVIFKVLDTNGQPKSGQTVDFTLNTSVGGLSLTSPSASSSTDGTVSTIVKSGIVATPVRVTATIRGSSPLIATQSDQLVVTTGIPDQDSSSLSVGNLNSESFNHDGVIVPITLRLADHFNNPVPDGTAVTFTTDAGKIIGSALTTNGIASVNWESSNPRITGGTMVGRSVILAYAVGEESFTDLNGNGLADPGEFTDTTEAFRDDNMNGVRDSNEPFIDFNNDGIFNAGDGKYNGLLQGSSFLGAPRTKHVFENIQMVMSTDAAQVTCSPNPITGPGPVTFTVSDLNGNTMASGTTITFSSPFGTLSGSTSFTVPQNIGHGQTLTVFIAAAETPKAQVGMASISVKSPGGLTTQLFVPISGNF